MLSSRGRLNGKASDSGRIRSFHMDPSYSRDKSFDIEDHFRTIRHILKKVDESEKHLLDVVSRYPVALSKGEDYERQREAVLGSAMFELARYNERLGSYFALYEKELADVVLEGEPLQPRIKEPKKD